MGRPSHWTGNDSHDDGWAFPPPILFLHGGKKRTGRGRSKRKKRLGGSVCAGAALLPPAGDGWQSRAAVRDGNAMPLGSPLARGCTGIPPASLSVAAGPVVDESLRNGPMGASAPTTARAARSEAERVERGAGQMRSCNPIFVGTRAAGIRCQVRTAPRRARRSAISNTQAPPHADPRTATLHVRAKLRPSAFFSSTGRGVFSFWARPKREWGAHPLWEQPPAGADTLRTGCLTASP